MGSVTKNAILTESGHVIIVHVVPGGKLQIELARLSATERRIGLSVSDARALARDLDLAAAHALEVMA